jgi:hypothetical protein
MNDVRAANRCESHENSRAMGDNSTTIKHPPVSAMHPSIPNPIATILSGFTRNNVKKKRRVKENKRRKPKGRRTKGKGK